MSSFSGGRRGLECSFFAQTQLKSRHLFRRCNILIAKNSGRKNEANPQPTRDVTPDEIAAGQMFCDLFSHIFSCNLSSVPSLCPPASCWCVCVHVCVACARSHHLGLAVLIYLTFLFTLFPLSSSVAAWKCSTCGESLSASPHQTHGTGSGPA